MPREGTEQKVGKERQNYRDYKQDEQGDGVPHNQLPFFRSFFCRQRRTQLENSHLYYLTAYAARGQCAGIQIRTGSARRVTIRPTMTMFSLTKTPAAPQVGS